jgi:hypothetical protein
MNKFSIPAFVEELTPDTANAKYSRAKLKMYYVGETVDRRLFTKEFSDKLISTIAYTPVVGFYSVADEDFVGHNNVQHIYGIVPAEAQVEYVMDENTGVTFAVTDVILYTGRPDEIGTIASKIVGKQHSLELDPNTVKYHINRDEFGNFKNLEFTEGELIGLSVLGDNDTPAFSGSEFFSAEQLPEFITDDNREKYQALFATMFTIEPTAEEVLTEIYKALDRQRIYGYVCEHVADKYVIVNTDYGVYSRYTCTRAEDDSLTLVYDCSVRSRFLSDVELEVLANAQKGSEQDNNDTATQDIAATGTEAAAGSDTTASTDGGEPATEFTAEGGTQEDEEINPEFEALRSDCERLERENAELNAAKTEIENTLEEERKAHATAIGICLAGILDGYRHILSEERMSYYEANYMSMSPDELIVALAADFASEKSRAESEIIEMSTIDVLSVYDEKDEAAVVQKYMNRGKN